MALIADCIADGLTDVEAAAVDADTMTQWSKDPEFSGAIKTATALRLRKRLARIEAGEPGWQGTAWALERLYPTRFARPGVLNQIAPVQQNGPGTDGPPEIRVITVSDAEFDVLADSPDYERRAEGELERREGKLSIVLVRQSQASRLIQNGITS